MANSASEKALLTLIGDWRTLPADIPQQDAVADFYRSLFPRLMQEAAQYAHQSRFIGFRATAEDRTIRQFFGVAVPHITHPVQELCAWVLAENTWRMWDNAKECTGELTWLWRDTTPSFFVGGFLAESLPEADAFSREGKVPFQMTTNAYYQTECVLAQDDIELVPYTPHWTEAYEEMTQFLRTTFSEVVLRVAHYGSTSIPEMPAKPVIDILVEVPSFKAATPHLIKGLNRPEWSYWWYEDHMIFIRRDLSTGKRTHHVHIAPPAHRLWEGVTFRDYLIAHPEDAAAYARLKESLSVRYRSDREQYTTAKTDFIRQTLQKIA